MMKDILRGISPIVAIALLLGMVLWTGVLQAQIYDNGDTETPAAQQSDQNMDTTLPSTTGVDSVNVESTTTGLPATGAEGMMTGMAGLLTISLVMAGVGMRMLRGGTN